MNTARLSVIAFALAFAFLTLPGALALSGDIVAVSGKVEAQQGQGAWKALKAGDKIDSGTVISTGFKSETTIRLGASVLTVKPLTRMKLSQLVEREDTVDTELYLEIGTVKAEVKSLNNKKNGFSVKSPIATASVRGTAFDMGDRLVVREGSVVCVNAIGQRRVARAGGTMNLLRRSLASPLMGKLEEMKTIRISSLPSAETTSDTVTGLVPPSAAGIVADPAVVLSID